MQKQDFYYLLYSICQLFLKTLSKDDIFLSSKVCSSNQKSAQDFETIY